MGDSTISQLPSAVSVNTTDIIAIDQGNVTKKATVAQLNAVLQPAAIGSSIHAAPDKVTPVNADEIGIWNSVTQALSKLSWSNLKATLAVTFAALPGSATQVFSVDNATADAHALNRITADGLYPRMENIASLAGFRNPADVSLTWNNTNRQLTIAPVGASFQFYTNDVLYTKTVAQSITIPNITGNYYFYYDVTGVLSVGTVFTNDYILIFAYIASLYWNSTTTLAVPDALSELHSSNMPSQTHLYLHSTIGTAFDQEIGGLLPSVTADGDGSLLAHIEFSATPGAIWDDDVQVIIPVKLLADNIPILYRTGTGIWTFDETSPVMVRTAGTGRAAYNQFTGGAWQLTEVTDTIFLLMHLFTIAGITKRWMMVMGQHEYATLNDAIAAASTEITTITGIPFAEHKDIASFVIQTDNTYTNAVKSRVRALGTGSDFIDWRFSEIGGSGASGTGGDVVGPVGATNNDIVVFDGATGKLIKDGGTPTAIITTAIHAAANKTTPVNADEFAIWDSVGTVLSRLTFANLRAFFVEKTSSTGSAIIPAGTVAQRDGSPSLGYTRFNTDIGKGEIWNGSAWGGMGGGATGGGIDDVFYENGQIVASNYTIMTGKNAMSAGPVTINTGITVTVPTGSVWSIV